VSIAIAIIAAIVAFATGVAAFFITSNPLAFFGPFGAYGAGWFGLSGILYLLYFALLEGTYQRTIGKSLLGLKVASVNNMPVNIEKAFIRNLSKIYWLLLLVDVIVGLLTDGRPGQRFLDRVANTIVVPSTERLL